MQKGSKAMLCVVCNNKKRIDITVKEEETLSHQFWEEKAKGRTVERRVKERRYILLWQYLEENDTLYAFR